ncbi:MAG: phosphate signaling complex protein PhoU [Bacillota bacterium]|nr:phosphate signaling complex protein PhoU [Bacillota bacterium]MDW7683913.1 phosphate signaling complex protein PhoU [Bacillota bacterium]
MQRSEFQKSLEGLQQDILKMGSLVEENIARSVESLARQDMQLAEKVFLVEKNIDKMELEIEETCLRLIATQQPMAKDLRKIASAFKIITDLERMGDYSVDIAKVTRRIGDDPLIKPLIDLPHMARMVEDMAKNSLDAYVSEDIELAEKVGKADDDVDALHKQIFRELLVLMMENPRTISQATHLLFVSRSLERIADHATNISESVIYLVSGRRVDLNE